MPKPAFTVVSPDRSAHGAAVVELCARTFNPYFEFRDACRGWYLLGGPYDWEASAVGLLGDELVTHWGIWPYRMRIGQGVVRCGGVGAVATAAEHRKRGYMARTAPHSIRRMRARGYDFSVLFGIGDFYHRFGYAPAWPEETWVLQREALPRDLPPVRHRALPPPPDRGTEPLHNRWNAGLTGTAVRPTYTRPFVGPSFALQAHGWHDARGRLAGHLLVSEKKGALVCAEATGAPDAALAVLRDVAIRRGLKELRFVTLPARSQLAARLRRLDCRLERQYARNGDAMARVIDLERCLRKLEPELTARLRASELGRWRGALLLGGDGEAVRLALHDGAVSVAPPGPATGAVRLGPRLAQLLLGSDDPLEICEAAGARPRGDAARLLPVLFPAQQPQLHRADRF